MNRNVFFFVLVAAAVRPYVLVRVPVAETAAVFGSRFRDRHPSLGSDPGRHARYRTVTTNRPAKAYLQSAGSRGRLS
jgi:hypothetical protein